MNRNRRRAGYTLIELLVSSAAATILMAGMTSSIYIASQVYERSGSTSADRADASDVLEVLTDDLGEALSFSEKTDKAITFTVPDRSGDSLPETLRYAWSGVSGDPLTYEFNGSPAYEVAYDVQNFNLTSLTRFMVAPPAAVGDPSPMILFVSTGTMILGPWGEPISFQNPQDADRISLIESFGYTVTSIEAIATQAEFDTALADAVSAYVSTNVDSTTLGKKLNNATVGVVNEEGELVDELGFAGDKLFKDRQDIEIIDNTHYVTSPFALGQLTFVNSTQSVHMLNSGTAPGLVPLAATLNTGSQYDTSLAVIATGDDLYGGGTAAGRRVELPWGGGSFDINALNSDGQSIMRRAIEWAAGAGESGGGGGPTNFGYETQFANTTGGVNSVQIGTQVVLTEDGTLNSITAYIYPGGGGKDYRFAIYSDNAGEPGNLLVESTVDNQSGTGWKTITVAPTPLTAGTYWLALAFKHGSQTYYHENTGGNTRHKLHNAVGNGFISTWPGSTTPYPYKVSIYGTYTP